MPLIFQSDVYDENRMAGLPWGMAMRNGKTGIYLDEGSTVSIDASGVIRSEGPTPAVILDARNATAVGFSTYRHSGSIGPRQSTAMVGATVQVIAGDYRYDALSGSVITNVAADVRPLPVSPTLLASYPNPFNSETTILFGMGAAGGRVRVAVYDIVGRRVATLVDDERPPGTYTVRFSCNGCSSGVYIVRCDTPSGSASRVLLLLR